MKPTTPCLAAAVVAALIVSTTAMPASAQDQSPRRAPWTTSRITGSPEPPRPYITERIFPSLEFKEPVEIAVVPGTNRLAIVEVDGKIYTIENKPKAESTERELFADIKPRNPAFTRLYGLTFHPKFTENRYCYVSYVLTPKTPDASRVSRFKVTATNPPRIDPDSEQVVITWFGGGHNGAHLQFGPDGCLYITTGDGGDSFPPDGRGTGQDISDLEAAILRIDVDHPAAGRAYRIPEGNPFVGLAGVRGEIWAYGFRNPWKMCFDPADGSLWTGDVGWEMWEMIDCVRRGDNFGWSVVEGPQPVLNERATGPTQIVPPTVAHSHIEARSITGGYFSTSPRLPELRGAYIYGDYVTGKIWALRHESGKVTWREELVDTPLQMASFGLDHAGDLLIADYHTGTLHRLVPNPRRAANAEFPRKLSETGLFANVAGHVPAVGVIPYRINAEPWADGTTAERLVALPGDSQLGVYKKTNSQVGYIAGEWEFPDGGVLAKTISLGSRRLETQVLHFDVDTWKAYNYLWNEEQTDAALADDVGRDVKVGNQTWRHASRTECLLCHTTRVGSILGFRPPQLDGNSDGGNSATNQLLTLEQRGLFAEPLPNRFDRFPDPHGSDALLEQRARSYLHVNCGHCHMRGGGGSSFFNVQFNLPLARTSLLGSRPTQGTFGILDAQIVAPGDPYRSVLYYRMSKLGHGRMPQFGSQMIDPRGTRLIRDWVESLAAASDSRSPAVENKRREERAAASLLRPEGFDSATKGLVSKLLSSPSGALQLADRIADGVLEGSKLQIAIEMGAAHADPAIRDLFERFIPEEQRIKRLGSDVRAADILAIPGDANRGRTLLLETAGVQCKNCHRIGDAGQALGPELTAIGKKLDKNKLLESILEPSKTIEPQFVSYLVETTQGEVVSGLLAERSEQEVVLKQADGKVIRIPAAEIERQAPAQKSLMPELLLRDMTAAQVADMLEYLAGLK